MNVAELIDILRDLDPDTVVEMAIVAPVDDLSEEITVDQYQVEGVLPRDPRDHDGEPMVWLIGGEADDVDEFIDAIETQPDQLHTANQGDVIDIKAASGRRHAPIDD
jgi:hypothetical protein